MVGNKKKSSVEQELPEGKHDPLRSRLISGFTGVDEADISYVPLKDLAELNSALTALQNITSEQQHHVMVVGYSRAGTRNEGNFDLEQLSDTVQSSKVAAYIAYRFESQLTTIPTDERTGFQMVFHAIPQALAANNKRAWFVTLPTPQAQSVEMVRKTIQWPAALHARMEKAAAELGFGDTNDFVRMLVAKHFGLLQGKDEKGAVNSKEIVDAQIEATRIMLQALSNTFSSPAPEYPAPARAEFPINYHTPPPTP